MTGYVRCWVACVLWLAAAAPAWPSGDPAAAPPKGDCIDAAIDAIQRRYDSIDDFRADFVQVTRSAALANTAASTSGTVTFAKPGKMRWAYSDPPNLTVSDGETLWIYDPAFGEVQRLSVGEEFMAGASIQFLLGQGDIRSEFSVVGRACSDSAAEIELTPIRPATYERIAVVANPTTGDLLQTRVADLLGNITEVTFSNLQTNLDPPEQTFRFEPQPGVKVLELGPDS